MQQAKQEEFVKFLKYDILCYLKAWYFIILCENKNIPGLTT